MSPRRPPKRRSFPLGDGLHQDPHSASASHQHPSCHSSSSNSNRHVPSARRRTSAVSPTLLALLASICASSVAADSSPSPDYQCPDFLCPSGPPNTVRHQPRAHARHRSSVAPSGRDVPTKYIRGDDGRWRRDTGWSLHGQSLSCVYVTATPSPPSNTLEVHNPDQTLEIDEPIPNGKDIIQSTPTSDARPSDIPNGWLTKDRTMYSAQAIIVFSLGLASVIALLIVACAIMRHRRSKYRKQIKAKKATQEQQQLQSLDSHADDSGGVAEDPALSKVVKRKKKRWIRSALHWKTNAQLAMKKRRPRGTPSSNSDSIGGDDLDQYPAQAVPDTSEQIHDAHGTSQDGDPARSEAHVDQTESRNRPPSNNRASLNSISGASLRTISLPPAYRTQRRSSRTDANMEPEVTGARGSPEPDAHKDPSGSFEQPGSTGDGDQVSANFSESSHIGHVATDDKAILARMANLTSAPEVHSDRAEHPNAPHAPEWPEELTERVPDDLCDRLTDSISPSSPPDDHLSPSEPSSICPSAPPGGAIELEPSAPLEEQFADHSDVMAAASRNGRRQSIPGPVGASNLPTYAP